ncbi:hypothetical protein ACRS5S_24835 [Nocardia asiatica]|uniref:hypothetical protein n=1 Tax=Nocardia asiatica TaxID=209252 RepID=UPI003EE24AFF
MRQAFAMYNAVVGVLLLFAAIMAAALLFNAMSANIGERLGELGALRAAEFDEELPGWAASGSDPGPLPRLPDRSSGCSKATRRCCEGAKDSMAPTVRPCPGALVAVSH